MAADAGRKRLGWFMKVSCEGWVVAKGLQRSTFSFKAGVFWDNLQNWGEKWGKECRRL